MFEKAKSGGDFDAMVKEHTDDSHPAFGDTGFPLEVGEYGLASYDLEKSKYGWHIVKRVK